MGIAETVNVIDNQDDKSIEEILMFSQVMREYTFELDDVCTDETNREAITQKIAEIFTHAHEFTN